MEFLRENYDIDISDKTVYNDIMALFEDNNSEGETEWSSMNTKEKFTQ